MIDSERSFIDIITGSIGILTLVIVILVLLSVINATIVINVDAPLQNDKFPFFIECKEKKALIVCRNSYLPNNEAKISLFEMCQYLKTIGITKADQEETWDILDTFLNSSYFDSDNFYIFAFLRSDGYQSFQELQKIVDSSDVGFGYIPVESSWKIREALKID